MDEIDELVDYSIARHIVGVHQRQVEGKGEEEERAPYTKIAMQRYDAHASPRVRGLGLGLEEGLGLGLGLG